MKERGREGKRERKMEGDSERVNERETTFARNTLEALYSNNCSHLQNSHHQRSLTSFSLS